MDIILIIYYLYNIPILLKEWNFFIQLGKKDEKAVVFTFG